MSKDEYKYHKATIRGVSGMVKGLMKPKKKLKEPKK